MIGLHDILIVLVLNILLNTALLAADLLEGCAQLYILAGLGIFFNIAVAVTEICFYLRLYALYSLSIYLYDFFSHRYVQLQRQFASDTI